MKIKFGDIENGELVAGGTGGSTTAFFIVCPTLAGLVGAYKEIQHNLLKFERLKCYRLTIVMPRDIINYDRIL